MVTRKELIALNKTIEKWLRIAMGEPDSRKNCALCDYYRPKYLYCSGHCIGGNICNDEISGWEAYNQAFVTEKPAAAKTLWKELLKLRHELTNVKENK